MSRQIYNVTKLLQKLKDHTPDTPGKKKFQKLVYLVENVGNVSLGFDYEIYFYGPYSSELDNVLAALAGEGLIHYDYQDYSHLICIDEVDESNEGSDFFQSDLTDDELKVIDNIFSDFADKSPAELELLTTAHFAFKNIQDKSAGNIINGVKKIKGSKYSDDKIKQALIELHLIKV